nr:unnamed protein product [Digitaria exilis]
MTKMESPLARSSRAAAEKSGWTQWNEWLAGSKDEEKREVMRPLLREHIRGPGLDIFEYNMSEKSSHAATGDLRPEGDVSDQNGRDASIVRLQEPYSFTFTQWDLAKYLQEAVIKKKYGGIMPRKTPLISKDHERAYFDSADWALGKQGGNPQKPKGPLEALRPKLQPTQQQTRSRRFLGESADNEESTEGKDKE